MERPVSEGSAAAILSGANVNFERLRYISDRFEIGERSEVILAATIDDKPGVLKRFCKELRKHEITEFNYRYAPDTSATIYARIHVSGKTEDRSKLFKGLSGEGFSITDMSDNELAKMHIGHMVGGHKGGIENEVLYRLEFPECRGALTDFLALMKPGWNVSILHYRKTGGAYAYVFIGIQIPANERKDFESRMKENRYSFVREQDNPAYKLFLS